MIQEPRDTRLPTLEQLRDMQPDEIGRVVLPHIASRLQNNPHGFVPREIARGIAERGCGSHFEHSEYAMLVGEGIGFLDRAGMFVNNPEQSSGHFYRLSRAGIAAAKTSAPAFGAASGQEARTLLHPVIAEAVLGDFERGRYDEAIFSAFKRIEVETNRRAGLSNHGKKTFYDAMGKDKSLTPAPIDENEAQSLREAFAGCYGAFRNPASHRDVNDDPTQVMRILLMASALYALLETMPDSEPAQ
jgi:uncharacterized protein (TIGR02391 family)